MRTFLTALLSRCRCCRCLALEGLQLPPIARHRLQQSDLPREIKVGESEPDRLASRRLSSFWLSADEYRRFPPKHAPSTHHAVTAAREGPLRGIPGKRVQLRRARSKRGTFSTDSCQTQTLRAPFPPSLPFPPPLPLTSYLAGTKKMQTLSPILLPAIGLLLPWAAATTPAASPDCERLHVMLRQQLHDLPPAATPNQYVSPHSALQTALGSLSQETAREFGGKRARERASTQSHADLRPLSPPPPRNRLTPRALCVTYPPDLIDHCEILLRRAASLSSVYHADSAALCELAGMDGGSWGGDFVRELETSVPEQSWTTTTHDDLIQKNDDVDDDDGKFFETVAR